MWVPLFGIGTALEILDSPMSKVFQQHSIGLHKTLSGI